MRGICWSPSSRSRVVQISFACCRWRRSSKTGRRNSCRSRHEFKYRYSMTYLHLFSPGLGTKNPCATQGLFDPSIHPLFSKPWTVSFSASSGRPAARMGLKATGSEPSFSSSLPHPSVPLLSTLACISSQLFRSELETVSLNSSSRFLLYDSRDFLRWGSQNSLALASRTERTDRVLEWKSCWGRVL